MLKFIDFFLLGFVFVFHSLLFPQKKYALSKDDHYILIARDLLFAFQMLIIFIVFYSKLAFLGMSYILVFGIFRKIIAAFFSKDQPHLMIVTSKNRNELNLNGVKIEFLLDDEEVLNFDLLKKAMSFESLDAIILNNVSGENSKIISKNLDKKIKIFKYK